MANQRHKKTKPAKKDPDIQKLLDDVEDSELSQDIDMSQVDISLVADAVDIEFATSRTDDTRDTPLDYNVSRDLVPVEDSTVFRKRNAKRDLLKMSDHQIKDNEWLLSNRIVFPEMGDYELMNNFREIRTRLLQKAKGKNISIMVVSLNRSMGATFTTVNLGAAFAYEGSKTSLLIDCNPFDRKLSHLLDLHKNTGLSDYIADPTIDAMSIIYPVGISRMRMIPFGSARNSRLEFMGSERLEEFVAMLKRRHIDRYIIINAPPLELSADAAILADLVDYVVLVVPYGQVTKRRLSKAINSLPRDKLAGVILNNCARYG